MFDGVVRFFFLSRIAGMIVRMVRAIIALIGFSGSIVISCSECW